MTQRGADLGLHHLIQLETRLADLAGTRSHLCIHGNELGKPGLKAIPEGGWPGWKVVAPGHGVGGVDALVADVAGGQVGVGGVLDTA